MIELYLLLILMVIGAAVALRAKDLISAVVSLGIVGFGLVLVFLMLQAPDLAITQIVVETLTLVILIAAILKTTREDISMWRLFVSGAGLVCLILFLVFLWGAAKFLPQFGEPILRMGRHYIAQGLEATGAANLVSAVILDFRGYDTLGEAAVLFTAVVGVICVLRKIGRKK
jgi:multisubunit Na+/H+ antiporter MnhB subunit